MLKDKVVMQAGRGAIRAGQNFLMPPYPLNNFEIQKFYQKDSKFTTV